MEGHDPNLQMAIVSVEPPTGFVRAMVGGRDWAFSQVNTATRGRATGSAFKPFVLATAFASGVQPDETFSGAPHDVTEECGVQAQGALGNYGGERYGTLDLRTATWKSVNTVYTRLILDRRVGVEPTMQTAAALGLAMPAFDPASHCASVALGFLDVTPLAMASAFGTFGNHGRRARADVDPARDRRRRRRAHRQHRRRRPGPAGDPRSGRRQRDRRPAGRARGRRHGIRQRHRPPRRRQDRDGRGQRQRLVRRLHADAGDGGVDGVPDVQLRAQQHQRRARRDHGRQPARRELGAVHAGRPRRRPGHRLHPAGADPVAHRRATAQRAGWVRSGEPSASATARRPAGPTSAAPPRPWPSCRCSSPPPTTTVPRSTTTITAPTTTTRPPIIIN